MSSSSFRIGFLGVGEDMSRPYILNKKIKKIIQQQLLAVLFRARRATPHSARNAAPATQRPLCAPLPHRALSSLLSDQF